MAVEWPGADKLKRKNSYVARKVLKTEIFNVHHGKNAN